MKPIVNKIDKGWVEKYQPCEESLEWYRGYLNKSPITILNKLIKGKKYDWANWFIVRVMTYHDYVSYAVFSAEQVIDIYEKKSPNDNRPRKAIEAAKLCIENPSRENKAAASRAARAAAAANAAYVAYAAYAAADAANAAYAATFAGRAAADAAYADAFAASAAYAYAANAAAYRFTIQLKILNYGMGLLKQS